MSRSDFPQPEAPFRWYYLFHAGQLQPMHYSPERGQYYCFTVTSASHFTRTQNYHSTFDDWRHKRVVVQDNSYVKLFNEVI